MIALRRLSYSLFFLFFTKWKIYRGESPPLIDTDDAPLPRSPPAPSRADEGKKRKKGASYSDEESETGVGHNRLEVKSTARSI